MPGVPLKGDPTAAMAELPTHVCRAAARGGGGGGGTRRRRATAWEASARWPRRPLAVRRHGADSVGGGADGSLDAATGRRRRIPGVLRVRRVAIRALATGVADPGSPPDRAAPPSGRMNAEGLAALLERCAQASSPPRRPPPPPPKPRRPTPRQPRPQPPRRPRKLGRLPLPIAPPPPPPRRRHPRGGHRRGDGAYPRVYAELIALGCDEDLLELPAGPLEQHLAERGAFKTARQGGALTRDESRHLELLARLYARRERHGLAAQVFFALAERVAGADCAVSLDERAALLDLALRHAVAKTLRRVGGAAAESVETLEGKIKVLEFQRGCTRRFRSERSRRRRRRSQRPAASLAERCRTCTTTLPSRATCNDAASRCSTFPDTATPTVPWLAACGTRLVGAASPRRGRSRRALRPAPRAPARLFPSHAAFRRARGAEARADGGRA